MARHSHNCPCIADTSVTFQWAGHEHESAGGKNVVGIRALSEIALFDFDLSKIKGTVISAVLTLTNPEEQEAGLPYITVSTIRAPWVEGAASDYDFDPGASSFKYRITEGPSQGESWAWPGSDLSDVTLGRSGSIWFSQKLPGQGNPLNHNQLHIDIPSQVIDCCRNGFSYGFAIYDDRGAREMFTRVYSRHTDHPPVLTIITADEIIGTGPAELESDSLHAIPADPDNGRDAIVVLHGDVPEAGSSPAIGYRALFGKGERDAQPLELWRLPHPPGENENGIFDLYGLTIHRGDELLIRSVDAYGRESDVINVPLKPALEPRNPIELDPAAIELQPIADKRLAVLLPGETIDSSGRLLGNQADETLPLEAVWIENDPAYHLEALAGEILDIPIALNTDSSSLRLSCPASPACQIDFYYAAYVASENRTVPDSLCPIEADKEFDIPSGWIMLQADIIIAPQAAGSHLNLSISIETETETLSIPLEINVSSAELPQTTSFVIELNSYNKFHRYYQRDGDFSQEEWDIQLDYHRQSHYHRCNFNILPYSQMGQILCDSAPELDEDGHIHNWTEWDKRYVPILDGSAFTKGLRAGIPVTYFYLPLHENWPGSMRKDYRYNIDTGNSRESYLAALREHDTIALPIQHAFTPEYSERLFKAAADFSRHLSSLNLEGPLFMNYFNNKHIYRDPGRVEGVNQRTKDLDGTSWWLLDEPNNWNDYQALHWFGDIVRKGYQRGGTKVLWCLDISRPQWDRDILKGQRDLVRTSRAQFKYPRLIRQWKREGSIIINYGSSESPASRPLREIAWAWHAWARGADGILPWSATPMEGFSNGDWLEKPDKLAIIAPVKEAGRWSRPTFRLKAYRRAQQDMEMCNMLVSRGTGRWYFADVLRQHLGPVSSLPQTFADEASGISAGELSPVHLEELRREIRRLVTGGAQ